MRMATKVWLMEAVVFLVATYGGETWATRKAAIMKMLSMSGIKHVLLIPTLLP